MGTAEFAVPSLQECASHHDVVAVVTQPPRAGSRGRPAPRPVADAARALHIPVLTPNRVRQPGVTDELLAYDPEAIVVAAYGQILPSPLLETPRHGAVNVHASLLPRWRGAAPVARAIMAGDTETGVCIMRMDQGLDTGPVYARATIPIADDATAPLLTIALAQLGSQLLIDVLAAIERGEATATPQSDDGVTLAPRLQRSDGELEWSAWDAVDIDRAVRALQPWPGVTLPLAGQRVRVLAGACTGMDGEPGRVLRHDGESVVVAARHGAYRMDTLQPPNGRPMSAAAYLRGRRTTGEA
jgi:methionyl-tRNA formyltransferase